MSRWKEVFRNVGKPKNPNAKTRFSPSVRPHATPGMSDIYNILTIGGLQVASNPGAVSRLFKTGFRHTTYNIGSKPSFPHNQNLSFKDAKTLYNHWDRIRNTRLKRKPSLKGSFDFHYT